MNKFIDEHEMVARRLYLRMQILDLLENLVKETHNDKDKHLYLSALYRVLEDLPNDNTVWDRVLDFITDILQMERTELINNMMVVKEE